MKKLVLIAGAALLLAGCNQGGTEDNYGVDTGVDTGSAGTNFNTAEPAEPGIDSPTVEGGQGGAEGAGGVQSGSESSSGTVTNATNP